MAGRTTRKDLESPIYHRTIRGVASVFKRKPAIRSRKEVGEWERTPPGSAQGCSLLPESSP